MAHCSACAFETRDTWHSPCDTCFAFSNFRPAIGPFLDDIMQPDEVLRNRAIVKLKELQKENNMNKIYVTVDGRTYKTIGGTMRITGGEDVELDIEAILAPRYETSIMPTIKDVIFNPPATIVFWSDNTKTVVQARGYDEFDPEKGLAMAISKKMLGNKRDYYHTFQRYQKKFEKQEKAANAAYLGTYSLEDIAKMSTEQMLSFGFNDKTIAGFRTWANCEGYEVNNE